MSAPTADPLRTAVTRASWRVPGRIEVFGKHTDYAGGNVLVCAASQAVTAVARPLTNRDAAGVGLLARSAAFDGHLALVPDTDPGLPPGTGAATSPPPGTACAPTSASSPPPS